ncbi:cyclophilin-like fold protein [Rhizobium leguminosarum]|uniref:cyclophilin-like fold protein n=1 Tax=Rhizobium leguminosarum TaxID=384 RepID=UPI002478D0B7|nr:cyclophilin-like fold protein [Rhizobium leguminosarum]
MSRITLGALLIAVGLGGPAAAEQRIVISSNWGQVTAELATNSAAKALVQMLPLTIEMDDHLRQEKTGNLPSPLPEPRVSAIFQRALLAYGVLAIS